MTRFARSLFVLAAALASGPAPGGIFSTSADLPQTGWEYRSAADVHADYVGGGIQVTLSQVQHVVGSILGRVPIGLHEIESFDSVVNGMAQVFGGPPMPATPVTLIGPTMVMVFNKVGHTTGVFQTEMLALDLQGNIGPNPVMIRESPTQASTGRTSIAPVSGGYHIDSFFDVFTELSVDGGQTWLPAVQSVRVTLVPEPGTWATLGIGLVLLGWIVRRRLGSA